MWKRRTLLPKIWFLAFTIIIGFEPLTATTITYKYGPCLGVQEISCPSASHVKFTLFTRENTTGHELDLLDARTLFFFNSANPTKILIHGFNMDSKSQSIEDMMKAYLLLGAHNVVTVDWSAVGFGPEICFPMASKNTEFVGQCVADLVQRLRVKTEDIHVVGHSLGARVAGYAANILKPFVLPRITGLDPATPAFGSKGLISKLDSSDAKFVDIIHTNIFYKGKVETAGHVDFYVNRGIFQPGCSNDKKSRKFPSLCSHMRSVEYFIESIKSPMGFWGWGCSTLSSLISGSCTPSSPAILMGEPVSHLARGIIHVETGSKAPFCLGPWILGIGARDDYHYPAIDTREIVTPLEYYFEY